GAAAAVASSPTRPAVTRTFLPAARARARVKPPIAIKPSRGEGETAIVFPGGQALPGVDGDRVFDAAIQRAGMLRVRDIDELFDAAETLTHGGRPGGEHLGIRTNRARPGGIALGTPDEGRWRITPPPSRAAPR